MFYIFELSEKMEELDSATKQLRAGSLGVLRGRSQRPRRFKIFPFRRNRKYAEIKRLLLS